MARTLRDIFPDGFKLSDIPPDPPLLPPEAQLRVAMSETGLTPPDDIVLDGKLRRFSTNGKTSDTSGWYVAYDGKIPAGAFGCWRQGLSNTWRADIGRELSHLEQMQHVTRMREIMVQREKLEAEARQAAAENASAMWESAPLASDSHPYLERKGISNPGLRVAPDGRLLAPMYIGDEIASLQQIDAEGGKRFLRGGKTAGAWWTIGGALEDAKRVYLAEGVATATSVFEAVGKPVAVAYSAGNMLATAQALRDVVGPLCEIVIVADNDESGTGQREGEKAAEAIGARVWLPPMIGDANDYARKGNDLASALEPAKPVDSRYKLVPAKQITELPPTQWQIKRILPARNVVAIYGSPGAGKSFMALDMAACIAEGREWMGYRTKKAVVVYLVLEAATGFSGRLKAWQMHHKRSLPDDFYVVAHSPFAFSSPADIRDLIESIAALVGTNHGGLVIFVDTLARAMGSYEENDNNDMGRVIAAADVICKALSAGVVAVAHPGKDTTKGPRGGSALLGGLDTLINLSKDEAGLRTWKIEKQKDGEDGITGQFLLQALPIGHDDDGDEITSAVVIGADDKGQPGAEAVQESETLMKQRRMFEDAIVAFGRIAMGRPFISADALNEFSKKLPFASDENRRQALSRAKKGLIAAGYIREVQGGYEATEHPVFFGAFIGLQ